MPNQMSTVPTQFFIDMASYLRHIEAFGTADQKAMAEQINKIAKQWMPPTDGVAVAAKTGDETRNGDTK